MKSPRSLVLFLFASSLIALLYRTADAQDEPKDARPDLLILDNAKATEPACSDVSYQALGACMRYRLQKADRWLDAVVKSCTAKAERVDQEYGNDFTQPRDLAAMLRRSQDTFERYRDLAATFVGEMTYPGRLAAAKEYGTAYELTVERAIMLLRRLSNLDPPEEVDLTKIDWCE